MKTDLALLHNLAARYCSYQERSTYEVEKKLISLKASSSEIKEVISLLKKEDYLNEVRFANSFVSGKFRLKKWGKIKIAVELKKKKILPALIQSALNKINSGDYKKTIQHLINKKEKDLKKDSPLVKNQKLLRFVLSKGFEFNQIIQLLNEPNREE